MAGLLRLTTQQVLDKIVMDSGNEFGTKQLPEDVPTQGQTVPELVNRIVDKGWSPIRLAAKWV